MTNPLAVAYKKPKIEKIFYSISEVANMFDLSVSNIRFWEKEFDILKPHKNNKGNRQFTPEDIENLRLIYHLVKERGMTLKGVQMKLKDNKEDTLHNFEIVKRLQDIRQTLEEIKGEIDDEHET